MVKNRILVAFCTKLQKARALEIGGLACAIFLGVSISANAAPTNFGDDTVKLNTMYDPAYDPIGKSIGAFILNPSVTASEKLTNNVYAVQNNASSDRITIIRPELLLKSDFTRHQLNVRAFLERGRYNRFSSENYNDHGINLDARIDVTGDSNIPFTFTYSRRHEDRENPDVQNNIRPLVYRMAEGTTGIVHEGQTITYKLITSVKQMVYNDSRSTTGPINESTRDRNILGLYASMGLNLDAVFAPYIYGNFLKLTYPSADISGISRDSNEVEAGLGTVINISPITRLSLNVGQKNRNFESSSYNDINTITYGANISWEPWEYLSFLVEADRSIQEATFSGTSSSIDTFYRLSANYQFRQNIIFQPSFGLLDRDYQGLNAGRLQTTNSGLNIVYKMNPNLWLNASYLRTNQNKKEDLPALRSFQKDVYGLSLKLQF